MHHRAHQRIETVHLPLLVVARNQQVARDVFHLLGEQRRAVHLDQAQDAMRSVQLVGTFLEQRTLVRPFRVRLERGARIVQGRREFLGDDVQCLRTDIGHTGNVGKLKPPMPLALRTFPDFPVITGSVKAGKRVAAAVTAGAGGAAAAGAPAAPLP